MIVGLGLDLTEIPRIARMVERWGDRFLNRIYTQGERDFSMARASHARHLAARFAAKEATLKALRVPKGLTWHEMEVTGGGSQCPEIRLTGRALEAANALGVQSLHLTISHTDEVAAAVVVATGDRTVKPVVDAAGMRAMDRITIEDIGVPGVVLMENAGRAVAARVRGLCEPGATVAVLCGGGNNGGDGHVIARVLRDFGYSTTVYLTAPEDRVAGDAAVHLRAFKAAGGEVRSIADADHYGAHASDIAGASAIVDALFGTGLDRGIGGYLAQLVADVNESQALVVAVDLPSGLSADTGHPLGVFVRADHTVTFACHKIATASAPGFSHCGQVEVAEIGVPERLAQGRSVAQLVESSDILPLIPSVASMDHKGSRGHVLAVAGAPGKWGAGRLVANSALRAGAGLVTLVGAACDDGAPDPVMTATYGELDGLLKHAKAVAVGPGLPTDDSGKRVVDKLISQCHHPLVIDADGLNHLVGRLPDLVGGSPAILTPHPGEAGRLLGISTMDVEADRLAAAQRLRDVCGQTVVLKGARTIIADPSGCYLVAEGGPELATAGSGDVLTGIIVGFCSQRASTGASVDVAIAGTFIHGRAGGLAAVDIWPRSVTAADVSSHIGAAIAALA